MGMIDRWKFAKYANYLLSQWRRDDLNEGRPIKHDVGAAHRDRGTVWEFWKAQSVERRIRGKAQSGVLGKGGESDRHIGIEDRQQSVGRHIPQPRVRVAHDSGKMVRGLCALQDSGVLCGEVAFERGLWGEEIAHV